MAVLPRLALPRAAVAIGAVLWAVAAVAVTLVMDVGRSPRAPAELMMNGPAATPPRPADEPKSHPKSRMVTYEPWEKVPS